MTKYSQEFVQQLYNSYQGEIDAELAALSALNNYQGATEQQLDDVLERTVGRHAPALKMMADVRDGHAADLTRVPAAYVQKLEATGLTQEKLVRMAQSIYPDLPREQAVAKWVSHAEAMPADPGYDAYYGDDGQPYQPGARPRESNG